MKRTQSILIVFASLLFACSPDGITTQFEPTPVLSQNIAPTDSPEAPDIAGTKLITRTIVKIPAENAPKPKEEITLEGWIAIGAYPWSWCPMIQQANEATG